MNLISNKIFAIVHSESIPNLYACFPCHQLQYIAVFNIQYDKDSERNSLVLCSILSWKDYWSKSKQATVYCGIQTK